MIVSIPPKLSITEFVKTVKGSSAYHINHSPPRPALPLGWQRGYGVFSLGSKQLDPAVLYVKNQKAHHKENNLMLTLEQDFEQDNGPAIWKNGEALAGIEIIKSWNNFED